MQRALCILYRPMSMSDGHSCESINNGWTDNQSSTVRSVDSGGPKKPCFRWGWDGSPPGEYLGACDAACRPLVVGDTCITQQSGQWCRERRPGQPVLGQWPRSRHRACAPPRLGRGAVLAQVDRQILVSNRRRQSAWSKTCSWSEDVTKQRRISFLHAQLLMAVHHIPTSDRSRTT